MVRNNGGMQGFGNLFARENNGFWKTRSWWIQILIWLLIVNGVLAGMIFGDQNSAVEEKKSLALMLFFLFMGMGASVGVVIGAQDTIVGEKHSGTAAWVLSKPAARNSFILSKLASHSLSILVTIVLVQGAVAYVIYATGLGALLNIPNFLAALGLVFVHLVFYLTLTVMLGTLFNHRGGVIGIPLSLIMGYQILVGLAPWLARIIPWGLTVQLGDTIPSMAQAVAMGQPVTDWSPLIIAVAWSIIFTLVAIWRFKREEF